MLYQYETFAEESFDVSKGYFLVDSLYTKRWDFIAHHMFGIFFSFQAFDPMYAGHRIIENGYILEISTPFLNMATRTKKKRWGILLILSFFGS